MGVKKKMKSCAVIFAVLAVFSSVTRAQDGNEIRVHIEPEEESLPKAAGETLAVTCVGDARDPSLFSKMRWTGPHGEVRMNEEDSIAATSLDTGKLLLVFTKPTPEMSGKYTCIAEYDNSETREDSVTITFYHSITYENCPDQQAIIIGQDGKIRCQINANPPAQVQWYKDGDVLDKESVQLENDGIVIRDVKESDAGAYRVRALVQSTGSLKWKNIKVEVHVPPTIKDKGLEDLVEIVDGERREITCQASGVPAPLYSWFNHRQQNLSDVDGFIVDRNTGTLTFRQVGKDDAGSYKCLAVNNAGSAEKSTNIVVIIKPEIRMFNNVTSRLNVEATLECRVTGDPKPDITIRKDGHSEPFVNGNERYSLDTREEGGEYVLVFTIQGVIRFDDGLYYCAVENKGGRAERVGHLEVQFPPDMSTTPNTERKTWNDNPVNISCIAEAIPNASIQWYFRNQQLQSNQIYYIFGDVAYSHLLVRPMTNLPGGLDVYGKYRCDARNQFGNNSIEINLQEAKVPGELLQFNFERYTATTITFMLRGPKDDGGLPIRYFVAEYREKDQSTSESLTMEWAEGSSYILEKLKPRTAYLFRFAAKNEAGVGMWSQEREIVMPAESAPENPNFLTLGKTSVYPDNFMVRWNMPENNGKAIDYFVLRYFKVEQDGQEWKQNGGDKSLELRDWVNVGLRYKIEGLRADTWYKVELRAHNDIGYSQPGVLIFKTSAGSDTSGEPRVESEEETAITTPVIVAIIIVGILIILGLLDATCYLKYSCGLFYCLRTNVCGHSPASEKVNDGTIEDGKGEKQPPPPTPNNGQVKHDANAVPSNLLDKGSDDGRQEKSKTEVDNPAFDKELSLKQRKLSDGELATEDTPMIDTLGAKDTKPINDQDLKNKSPKGSKSSIAKDSLV